MCLATGGWSLWHHKQLNRKPHFSCNSAAPSKPATAAAAAAPATKPAVEAPPAAPEDPKVALEKQIRNLGKKVRQCAEIAEKKAGGAKLDPDQESKLAKSLEW